MRLTENEIDRLLDLLKPHVAPEVEPPPDRFQVVKVSNRNSVQVVAASCAFIEDALRLLRELGADRVYRISDGALIASWVNVNVNARAEQESPW